MIKKSIQLITAAMLISSIGCENIEVKNESHFYYQKATTIEINGKFDINNIDSTKQQESKSKKLKPRTII